MWINEEMEEMVLGKRVLNMGLHNIDKCINRENWSKTRSYSSKYKVELDRTLKNIRLKVHINLERNVRYKLIFKFK
jgi:hypothetical protein